MRAARTSILSGITSNVDPSTSTVRHSESPQTEVQRLARTSASSHSSRGFPAIQIRLDSEGCALKDSSSISLISRVGTIPWGRRISFSSLTARVISWKVPSQRGHVSPFLSTSLCQTIGSDFILNPVLHTICRESTVFACHLLAKASQRKARPHFRPLNACKSFTGAGSRRGRESNPRFWWRSKSDRVAVLGARS